MIWASVVYSVDYLNSFAKSGNSYTFYFASVHTLILLLIYTVYTSEKCLLTGALVLSYIVQRLWPNDHIRQ